MATDEVTIGRKCQQCGHQDSRAMSARDSLYPHRCDPTPTCRNCGSAVVSESRPLPPSTSELIDEWLANSDAFIGEPASQDIALAIWLTIPQRLALLGQSDIDSDKRLELLFSLICDFEDLEEQAESEGRELTPNELATSIIDCFARHFDFVVSEQQKGTVNFGMTFDDEILPLVRAHLASQGK